MSTLERAIQIAVEAHAGQMDKAGDPYILHPLRLMLQFESPSERIVAVLHDVLEDTPWTRAGLEQEGFPQEALEALEALTRRDGESYEEFVLRAAENSIAARVKAADIEHNMDLSRLSDPSEKDLERQERYRRALELLKL